MAAPIFTTFNGGETTPLVDGRLDLDWYRTACIVMENMIPLPWGPAERRPGTVFVAVVKTITGRVALVRFEFSTEQAYIIEVGHLYFRFYKDRGRIVDGGGNPVEIATPYTEANLFNAKGQLRLCFTQSADVMYLTHPAYAPRKLSRTSHVDWTLTVVDFIDGPYLDENATATTMVASAGTGSVTVTASAVTGINSAAGFLATDVGRLIRIKNGANWSWLKITAWTDTTHVTATVQGTQAAPTSATATWQMGLWSDTTGWPAIVEFHEERLVFGGGTTVRPQREDGSKSNDFENFTPGVNDGDPFAYNVASNEVNVPRWMASLRDLIIGTVGAIFRVGTDSTSAPLTPTNVNIRPHVRLRAAEMAPVLVNNRILFLERMGRRLYGLFYSLDQDGYQATDLSIRAEHVTRGGLVAMAYAAEPWSIVWAARADGTLVGFTYTPEHDVTAWHRHLLGGGGKVESVACIPGTDGDELWMVVRRTVHGVEQRYIEVLGPRFEEDAEQKDAYFVDCGLSYDGAPKTVFEGLDHVEGETVQILADGGERAPQPVVAGRITLDSPASRVHVGLPFVSKLQPTRIEAGQAEGTARTKPQHIAEVAVNFFRSIGCKFGRSAASLDTLAVHGIDDPMDAPPPLYTGTRMIDFRGISDDPTGETAGVVMLVQDTPNPMTVRYIVPRIETGER
jgi:hypothetical protein